MNFTIYPVSDVARDIDGAPFDVGKLPFEIAEGVRIEAVNERFRPGSFELWRERLGGEAIGALERVRFALVHRYDPAPIFVGGELVGEPTRSADSELLVRLLAACLRLIRPMRQRVFSIHGTVRADESFDVAGFDVPPVDLIEVPEVQKLFKLRTRDAEDLKAYAPDFLRAMRGEFWKFRMAIQFYELGHFQHLDWKARYLLWCSALESIYTSHGWEHQGTLVATSRIKWFLSENTSIYPRGDLSDLLQDPGIHVGQIVADLYEMRNFIAHGDRIPNSYFTDALRQGFNGDVVKAEVLLEAVSFIVRASLLKILRDGLMNHFAGAASAEAFFGGPGLTKTNLRRLKAAAQAPGARP